MLGRGAEAMIRRRMCLGVFLFSLSGACASTSASTSANASASAAKVKIRVSPSANVNDQRSVYVLVRAVAESDYRTESYDEVAAKVVRPDDSVQNVAVALPGVPLSFSVAPSPKLRIAVYALFEQPRCGQWRVLLPEGGGKQVALRLEDGRICVSDAEGRCGEGICAGE